MDCVFCGLDNLVLENELAQAVWDIHPVSRGHLLVMPKRHVESYFDARAEEKQAMWALVDQARDMIIEEYKPGGFNIALNDGKCAGQTVMHAHLHLIPRYGEMASGSVFPELK